MTVEQLEKANKIYEELKEKKKFLKAFDAPYVNAIRACSYCGDRDCTKLIFLSNEPELSDIIRRYVVNQITELEKQLEEIFSVKMLIDAQNFMKGFVRKNATSRFSRKKLYIYRR